MKGTLLSFIIRFYSVEAGPKHVLNIYIFLILDSLSRLNRNDWMITNTITAHHDKPGEPNKKMTGWKWQLLSWWLDRCKWCGSASINCWKQREVSHELKLSIMHQKSKFPKRTFQKLYLSPWHFRAWILVVLEGSEFAGVSHTFAAGVVRPGMFLEGLEISEWNCWSRMISTLHIYWDILMSHS